jgi:hypothetical protein
VWAGSNGQGYTFYDPVIREWDRDFDEWPDPRITVVRALGTGVYIGTQDGLLLRPTLNRADLCSQAAPGCIVPSYAVTDYALLGESLWVGTRAGLGRFNGAQWDSASALPPGSVGGATLSLAVFDGTLFEANGSLGIRRLIGESWESAPLYMTRLRVTDEGLLGVGEGHLYRWTGLTWLDLQVPIPAGFALRDVARVGGAWFLATNRGLLRWDGADGVENLLPPGPPLGGLYSGVAADGRGNIWAGTSETDIGVIRFDGNRWLHDDMGVPRSWVLAMIADRSDNLWAGLCCCPTPAECPLTVVPPPGSTTLTPVLNARALASDPQGRVWAGSWRTGVQVLVETGGTWSPVLDLTPENTGGALGSNLIYAIGTNSQGTYIGHDRGVDYWPHRGDLASGADGSNWVSIGTGAFGLLDPSVTAITVAGEDCWIATSGGIHRFRDGLLQERCPSKVRGDLSDTPRRINALAMDRQGGLWVGTDRGILHLPRGAACDASGGDFVSYTVANSSLPDDRVVAVANNPRDGSVWFGMRGGLLRIDPRILSGGPPPPDKFLLYPNPLDITVSGRGVIFGIEQGGIRVTPVSRDSLSRPEVFDVAGRLVGRFEEKDELSGPAWFWSGINLNSRFVAPGLYFVRARTAGGDVVILRLGVLR